MLRVVTTSICRPRVVTAAAASSGVGALAVRLLVRPSSSRDMVRASSTPLQHSRLVASTVASISQSSPCTLAQRVAASSRSSSSSSSAPRWLRMFAFLGTGGLAASGVMLMSSTDPTPPPSSSHLSIVSLAPTSHDGGISVDTDIITSSGIRILGRRASLWDRFVAWLVDAIACAGAVGATRFVLLTACGVDAAVVAALSVMIVPVYLTFAIWWTNGQSLGKWYRGIRVRRINGHRMDMQTAAARMIGGIVLVGGTAWCLVDRHQRALHDHLAGTVVVRAITSSLGSSSDTTIRLLAASEASSSPPPVSSVILSSSSSNSRIEVDDDDEMITLPALSPTR